ncbi:MAG: hypothetical protein JWN40_1463 [Phycisphaerales bacterium]|nr:hypothetical protein [Phycisphaerales bacterium]
MGDKVLLILLNCQWDYLSRLRARMDTLKFSSSDPLYASVCRAVGKLCNVVIVAASSDAELPPFRGNTKFPT